MKSFFDRRRTRATGNSSNARSAEQSTLVANGGSEGFDALAPPPLLFARPRSRVSSSSSSIRGISTPTLVSHSGFSTGNNVRLCLPQTRRVSCADSHPVSIAASASVKPNCVPYPSPVLSWSRFTTILCVPLLTLDARRSDTHYTQLTTSRILPNPLDSSEQQQYLDPFQLLFNDATTSTSNKIQSIKQQLRSLWTFCCHTRSNGDVPSNNSQCYRQLVHAHYCLASIYSLLFPVL